MGRLKALYKAMRMAFLTTFRFKFLSKGPGLYVGWRVYIKPNAVKVGHRVFIGPESFLSSAVTIGNWVMLAGRVSIVGGDHRFDIVGTPMIVYWSWDPNVSIGNLIRKLGSVRFSRIGTIIR